MRHGASLLASLEGMSRTAYNMAVELSNNSRSGLTTRFLAKKLEVPAEEIEYLLDVNHRLFFTDLTKIKLVPEGYGAVRRIREGLNNHGDIPSLCSRVKALGTFEFQMLEERLGSENPLTKKAATDILLEKCYQHPDSLLDYVATELFSETAREVFDILWQSKNGVLPVSQIHALHGGNEYAVEQALLELIQGFACAEMFRFDAEDRLVRAAGLLSEVRQHLQSTGRRQRDKNRLRPLRTEVDSPESRGLSLSDTLSRLVAAIAAQPARVRSDGELFREDLRRLAPLCGEDEEPSLSTCLWLATTGLKWLTHVDQDLVVRDIGELLSQGRLERHRTVCDQTIRFMDCAAQAATLSELLSEMEDNAWYNAMDLVEHAFRRDMQTARPVLKLVNGAYEYVDPATSARSESKLARALEELFFWLGLVERGLSEGNSAVRVTPLGRAILLNTPLDRLEKAHPNPASEIVVQPNFDIMVPIQDMDPLLTVPLEQFAKQVSSGQVSVYRVSRESYLQAVQNGHNPATFTDFLVRHNRGGALPENVRTTLEDWRGGIKKVRLRTFHVIEADDPMTLLDLAHRRRVAPNIEQVDPHRVVQFKGLSKKELARLLEKEGFVVE
ncbi:MAG TPA: helicase-associated domain-containing protein [Candidatus Hydrogenedentes bacterium]|nr:helicase-associated domain-containing protein [Candidatus Hydrogenedentota bacterium]